MTPKRDPHAERRAVDGHYHSDDPRQLELVSVEQPKRTPVLPGVWSRVRNPRKR